MMALVADHLPLTLARLAGVNGTGASLDNTLRVGPRAEHDWVLLECLPELGAGGYGHGTVHLWAPDGRLLAIGSQSLGHAHVRELEGARLRARREQLDETVARRVGPLVERRLRGAADRVVEHQRPELGQAEVRGHAWRRSVRNGWW